MQSPKKVVSILLAVFVIAVATTLAAIRQQEHDKSSSLAREEATPIQEGVMTEKQSKHSKIFKGYGGTTGGRKLRDLVAENGEVEIINNTGNTILPSSFSLNEYLRDFSCQADLIVIGLVEKKSSQLIEEGTFTFTDYEVTTENILKNNAVAPIKKNENVTVTRAGGAIKLNGLTIRALDHRQEPLKIGERYLFYLRFIPESGGYRSLGRSLYEDTFLLSDTKISQVSKKALPIGWKHEAEANPFMTDVNAAIKSSCNN